MRINSQSKQVEKLEFRLDIAKDSDQAIALAKQAKVTVGQSSACTMLIRIEDIRTLTLAFPVSVDGSTRCQEELVD